MNKTAKTIIAIIIVAAIVVAAVVVGTSDSGKDKDKTNTQPTSQESGTPDTAKPSGDKAAAVAAVITYNGKRFTPETTTIKTGSAITVINKSHNRLDFKSESNSSEPELNAGNIKPGKSKTFAVTKKGTWGFRNHFDSSQHGRIIVQ